MKPEIARITLSLRHTIAKVGLRLIAPRLLKNLCYPREMIQFMRGYFGKRPLRGVEIGVAKGDHAKQMLKNLQIIQLYLIDPYQPYVVREELLENWNMEIFYKACKNLRPYKERITFILEPSEKAWSKIPKGLDFAYIDGDHSYPYVIKDLELYYLRVRDGGLLGGHDFGATWPGVARAVLEFSEKKGLSLKGRGADFWMIKKDPTF